MLGLHRRQLQYLADPYPAAPIAVRSTSTSGSADTQSTSKTVPVPANAQMYDIVFIFAETWTSATEPTATFPTGFAEIAGAHATLTAGGGPQTIRVAWKRLGSTEDVANYTVNFSSNTWNMAHAMAVSGGLLSGDPIEATNTATGTTGYPSTTVSVATLALLLNVAATFQAVTTTPPTSFTEHQDTNVLHTNSRVVPSTGSYTASGGTTSANGEIAVALVAVKPSVAAGNSATLSLATETDAAQSITKAKALTLGVATETDAAFAVSVTKSRSATLSVATETDTAYQVSVSTAAGVTFGVAQETDAAPTLAAAKTKILSLPLESDTAQALSYSRSFTLGVATEVEAAQSLTVAKTRTLSTAAETEQARGLSVAKTIIVGRGQETDTAIALNSNGAVTIFLSRAQETDVAPALSYARLVTLSTAVETEAAYSLFSARTFTLSTATETDQAHALSTVRRDITITALGDPTNAWAVTDLVGQTEVTAGALQPAAWATTGTSNGWLTTGPESEAWTVSDPQL